MNRMMREISKLYSPSTTGRQNEVESDLKIQARSLPQTIAAVPDGTFYPVVFRIHAHVSMLKTCFSKVDPLGALPLETQTLITSCTCTRVCNM
jgi:hypothetical protein